MKPSHIPFLFFIATGFFSCKTDPELAHIKASDTAAQIIINDSIPYGNWTIMPEVNPDVLGVEVRKNEAVKVTFKTDMDSLVSTLTLKDSVDFVVVLNEKDSAYTRIAGVKPKVEFTDAYIKKNRGKWSVEINEVQELFQVIAVITPTGLADTRSMIINHDTTEYYLATLKQFLPFKEEPIVSKIDSLLRNNWYINLKADANALEFKADNSIGKTEIYDRMRGSKNLLDPYLNMMADFAGKSDFRTFFDKHKPLYDSLIDWHNRELSTKKQWEWLEKQFPDHSYDNYRITFSPLVKGNHSTVRFNDNGFKQAVMFIRPPYRMKTVSKNVSNGLVTRFVFTEIDHNYVNPETDKYVAEVNSAFADRQKWTNGKESKGYQSPYTIFNEYMTWSVYLLYCYDNYNAEDFEVINEKIVNYMINRRGFQQFADFHSTLLALYKEKSSETTVADLYPPLLDWAADYALD